ncbi:hypothetical protein CRYUN_Cryun05aG0002300 [Craigia yunnanensis]
MICFLGKCGGECKLEWSYMIPEIRLLVKTKAKAEMTRKGMRLREEDGHGNWLRLERRPPPPPPPPHTHTTPSHSEEVEVEPPNNRNRLSLAAVNKRVSWNRSLSTRGRTSIAVGPCVKNQPQQKQTRRRGKPPVPKLIYAQCSSNLDATNHLNFLSFISYVVTQLLTARSPSFEKEREYFQEVDAFELLEESPSTKHFGTCATGNQTVTDPIPHVSSRLEKWLFSKKINFSCGPSTTLSKILETPAAQMDSIYSDGLDFSSLRTPEKCNLVSTSDGDEGCEDINAAIRKLSLASTSTSTSSDLDHITMQKHPALYAIDYVILSYNVLDPESIAKVGEGTYGEAFRAGNTICKIVPFDGDFPVNGEVQKKSEELLAEAVLLQTLNSLREFENDDFNACMTFIETIDLKVCQGPYDAALNRAWEKWDEKNGSENDHPKEFPEKQVTAALAVAEAAYEFEHRDLHWVNILLSRNDSVTMKFILEGKQIFFKTFGLSISIIDFTLSRINTGENILFLDLSLDPYLFKGPKGDKQSETYRKMEKVTEDNWEGSFPRTNVLWLLYLVDILLLKKTFVCSSKNARDLRSLKKRLEKYHSAKEAIFYPFFGDLLVDHSKPCE